ncbi:MAG: sigma-54-dependent Fis family transcriptional regulator [Armatimonadetes bacterium]|nr:sigma-54-dependent Fis family transcriptional regulator [Armatimonadota bacterium]
MLDLLRDVLTQRGFVVECMTSGEEALAALGKKGAEPPNLMILDLDFGPGKATGLDVLATLASRQIEVPTILLTGKGTVESAVQALKMGAVDFLEKDSFLEENLTLSIEKAERLVNALTVQRMLREENIALRREHDYIRERTLSRYEIVGEDPAWVAAVNQARALASVPRPVLIVGERGTGKELIAATVHYEGERRNGPFVVVNCAAIAEGLLECELFGQEANAFDGAPFKLGRFEIANHGTLFLDEIGNMSLEFQSKILRIVEYQQFERVQGTETIEVDVRVIAATNADLHAAMEAKRFREDLYDRLAFQTIKLPPLRDRKADIPALAVHFVHRFAAEVPGVEPKAIDEDALSVLQTHDWPGNTRELKRVIESTLCRSTGPTITCADLPAEIRTPNARPVWTGDPCKPFADRIAEVERAILADALARSSGDERSAAQALSLPLAEFRKLRRKHGV